MCLHSEQNENYCWKAQQLKSINYPVYLPKSMKCMLWTQEFSPNSSFLHCMLYFSKGCGRAISYYHSWAKIKLLSMSEANKIFDSPQFFWTISWYIVKKNHLILRNGDLLAIIKGGNWCLLKRWAKSLFTQKQAWDNAGEIDLSALR